jgi:hypothetical protein
MHVHVASMTSELMRSAFAYMGIYPFNPQIFTEEDFAPAKSFSTLPHVPSSFPPEVPSSSPLPSDASDSASSDSDGASEDQSDVEMGVTPLLHPLYMDTDDDNDPDYVTLALG